jgi:hypothetical protein
MVMPWFALRKLRPGPRVSAGHARSVAVVQQAVRHATGARGGGWKGFLAA